MEVRLELGAVVRLDDVDAKRQAPKDFVDDLDRRALVAGVVDLEHANAGAIVDRRELTQVLPRQRRKRGRLSADGIRRLGELGFIWAPYDHEMVTALMAYRAKHGDCNLPEGYAQDARGELTRVKSCNTP